MLIKEQSIRRFFNEDQVEQTQGRISLISDLLQEEMVVPLSKQYLADTLIIFEIEDRTSISNQRVRVLYEYLVVPYDDLSVKLVRQSIKVFPH